MSYFIFNQSNPLDIFANTLHVSDLGGRPWVVGRYFRETRHLCPGEMKLIIERDIEQCIREGNLPEMAVSVTIEREGQIPVYRIEILDLGEPLVFRFAEESESPINCEDSRFGRLRLTSLARYIREKLSQLLWGYNADLASLRGIYGHTHFTYQVAFAPQLIERQAHSINRALSSINSNNSTIEIDSRIAA